MLRVIREIQPTWVVGENVPGLVNWSNGVVFEEVQSDLEAEGYEVQSFILPAAGVGAPHRRDRVWIVAYSGLFGQKKRQQQAMGCQQLCEERTTTNPKSEQNNRHGSRGFFSKPTGTYEQGITSNSDKCTERSSRTSCEIESNRGENNDEPKSRGEQAKQHLGCGYVLRDATHANSGRLPSQKHGQTQSRRIAKTGISSDWQNFPTQSPVCDGNDGISADLVRYILRNGGDCYTEEEAEKEAKRIISKVRAEGIKAGGNAIVHQVALQIFKAIEEFENLHRLMQRH